MKRILTILFVVGFMINIGGSTVLADNSVIEFDEKYEIELDKEWKVKFTRKVNLEEIREVSINKSDSKIPIDIKNLGTEELVISGKDKYETDSRYYLKILLNNGNNYGMYFNTIKSESKEDLKIELEVLRLVNIEREKLGIAPLKLGDKLSKVARLKSQDMADNNYFSHISPNYGSPFDMIKRFDIRYKAAGENIAMGQTSPKSVMTAWMNSPGHRANILNPNFGTLGVGYIVENRRIYWTQIFID